MMKAPSYAIDGDPHRFRYQNPINKSAMLLWYLCYVILIMLYFSILNLPNHVSPLKWCKDKILFTYIINVLFKDNWRLCFAYVLQEEMQRMS